MDMRDKFELLYAAKMSEGPVIVTPTAVKMLRSGDGGYSSRQTDAAWLGFQLAAAAVKRGEDIQ